jgi:hypothetical protein
VFADEAAGAVGDAGERHAVALAGGPEAVFGGVADGVDIEVGGALMLVGLDAARRADGEARGDRDWS